MDYARRGEHEKVVFLFEKLPLEEQVSLAVFPVYLESLQALKKHKDAEKLTKKALKLRPEDATLAVTLVEAASTEPGTSMLKVRPAPTTPL